MFFKNIITDEHVANWLTAEYGNDLAVWEDGRVEIIESNLIFRDESPVARVRCPGIGNIDSTEFTADFCATRNEAGQYVVDGPHHEDQGRVVGDLEAVIRECCRDGDVSRYYEDLCLALEKTCALLLKGDRHAINSRSKNAPHGSKTRGDAKAKQRT